MIADFEVERKEIQKRHEEQIKNLNQNIKELKENRSRLEESAYVMKMELESLTRYDKRREAMSDIEGAFEKLG
jgi:chromosome segregation ATPase